MVLTPICYYTDDPAESDARCSRCGRLIQYTHIAQDSDGYDVPLGVECVRRLRKSGEIEAREPLNGRYDWKLDDVRHHAYWLWYGQHLGQQ